MKIIVDQLIKFDAVSGSFWHVLKLASGVDSHKSQVDQLVQRGLVTKSVN